MKTKFLLFLILSLCAPTLWAYDFEAKNEDGKYIKYNLLSSTECEVASYRYYQGDINIPPVVYYRGNNFNVIKIGERAFSSCDWLTSVTIPNSVTSIGDYAFDGCGRLTSVTIPNSVTSIGKRAFNFCWNLTSVTIPNSVISIGDQAFSGCSELTSVTIPNSVTSIGDQAFSGCRKLTTITIPNSVTSIGECAFAHCSLTSIKVDEGNSYYDSRNDCNAIITTTLNGNTPANTLIFGCSTTIIPNSVTSIGDQAFSGSGLTSITIPNSVTSIGYKAFYFCSKLTSITIPNSVTSIRGQTFYFCRELTSITIPNSVTSIGYQAFYESGLTSITIPNSVTSIGDYAFHYCNKLTSVQVLSKTPPCVLKSSNYVFDYDGSKIPITLEVPKGSKEAYRSARVWKDFWEIVEFEEETGIDYIKDIEPSQSVYDFNGLIHNDKSKGMRIIRKSNGNSQKVYIK